MHNIVYNNTYMSMSNELVTASFELADYRLAQDLGFRYCARVQSVQVDDAPIVYDEERTRPKDNFYTALSAEVAEGVVSYMMDHRSTQRPRYMHPYDGNCATFVGVARGWLPSDELDYNLNGAGGLRVFEDEVQPVDDIQNLLPGEAYGVSSKPKDAAYPRVLSHVILGSSRAGVHMGVLGRGKSVYVGSTTDMLRAYKAHSLLHIPGKPREVGTFAWKERLLAEGEAGRAAELTERKIERDALRAFAIGLQRTAA